MLEEATQFKHQQYILYQRADSEGKSACASGSLRFPYPWEISEAGTGSHICNTSFPICSEMRSRGANALLIGQLAQ